MSLTGPLVDNNQQPDVDCDCFVFAPAAIDDVDADAVGTVDGVGSCNCCPLLDGECFGIVAEVVDWTVDVD